MNRLPFDRAIFALLRALLTCSYFAKETMFFNCARLFLMLCMLGFFLWLTLSYLDFW